MTTEQLQELAEHLDYVEIHAGMIRQHLEAVEKYLGEARERLAAAKSIYTLDEVEPHRVSEDSP
ncbi:hypothetical protein [Lewinella sp. W8]|uniref:hypothetical protein n=1 Tax=Lewinella sp. W8 TaxID=2528208 RepID=UPI001068B5CB|nr:hypothetical protein [Lewinella sp. W8]MTB53938.1 hypothetical protein [Lewinella sp. W8]